MDACPSGKQLEIIWRGHRAAVVEVGGGVHQDGAGDQRILGPCPVGALCDGAPRMRHMPWLSRLPGGRYRAGSAGQQTARAGPEARSAIHGSLRWRPGQVPRHGLAAQGPGHRADDLSPYALGSGGVIRLGPGQAVSARWGAPYMSETTAQAADALVIFGITGDLARKMTFRALYRLEVAGRLECPIIGVARDDWSEGHLVASVRETLQVAGEAVERGPSAGLPGGLPTSGVTSPTQAPTSSWLAG